MRVRHGLTVDTTLALTIAITTVVVSALVGDHAEHLPHGVGYALLLLSATLLAFRRRAPICVMAGAIVASLLYYTLGFSSGAFTVAPAVAIYFVIGSGRRMTGFLGAGAYLALVFLVGLLRDSPPSREGGVWLVIWLAVAVAGGEMARARNAFTALSEEHAAQAERTREEESQRRTAEERLRIARDLHDILSHNVAVINIQAGVAAHLLDSDPRQAAEAVMLIKQASRDVMTELRTTLDVLRRGDEDGPPSLERVDHLVRNATASGVRVTLRMQGQQVALPAATDLAAYRIVQEALTNVIRHSGASRAEVIVRFCPGAVMVRIEDDGDGARTPQTYGTGMTGMLERVAAVNGDLSVTPVSHGGLVVEARLPVESAKK
ncbi:sensor histidine kinase [Streptosporangium sp. KLBMP 9127]|nr:sensor histidine kinase [Streptosporangium sp. KLBMP 9127]